MFYITMSKLLFEVDIFMSNYLFRFGWFVCFRCVYYVFIYLFFCLYFFLFMYFFFFWGGGLIGLVEYYSVLYSDCVCILLLCINTSHIVFFNNIFVVCIPCEYSVFKRQTKKNLGTVPGGKYMSRYWGRFNPRT